MPILNMAVSHSLTMDVRSSLREMQHFERPAEVCQFEWGYADFRYYVERVRKLYARYGR